MPIAPQTLSGFSRFHLPRFSLSIPHCPSGFFFGGGDLHSQSLTFLAWSQLLFPVSSLSRQSLDRRFYGWHPQHQGLQAANTGGRTLIVGHTMNAGGQASCSAPGSLRGGRKPSKKQRLAQHWPSLQQDPGQVPNTFRWGGQWKSDKLSRSQPYPLQKPLIIPWP